MGDARTYHHGDLRAALLEAGEAELAEAGIEAFSLRKVARRAGVSHAAPAHHFGDARGLLTALAARGYDRLMAMADGRAEGAAPDPGAQLAAYGLAYTDFAREHTALFRLCFTSTRPEYADPVLKEAADASFGRLARLAGALAGREPAADGDAMTDPYAVWAMTHGLADLLASGRMKTLAALPAERRDARVLAILARALPSR